MDLKNILLATRELEEELNRIVDNARTFNATLPKIEDADNGETVLFSSHVKKAGVA